MISNPLTSFHPLTDDAHKNFEAKDPANDEPAGRKKHVCSPQKSTQFHEDAYSATDTRANVSMSLHLLSRTTWNPLSFLRRFSDPLRICIWIRAMAVRADVSWPFSRNDFFLAI